MIALGATGDVKPAQLVEKHPDPRELPFVKEALAQIEKGGYPEALARIGALLGQFAGHIPLERLAMTESSSARTRFSRRFPKMKAAPALRGRRNGAHGAGAHPEALPALLSKKEDRERALQILK